MKKELIIYTNIKNYGVLEQLLNNYKINFKIIDLPEDLTNINDNSVVIFNKPNNNFLFDFSSVKKNYLLITNSKQNIKPTNINSIHISKTIHPHKLKNIIDSFLRENKVEYNKAMIIDKKIINTFNKKFCYLTDIEKEILVFLIKNKSCNKEFIKKNILNIKSDIITNSIDNHLSRIRKKIDRIGIEFQIISKNEKIYLKPN